jgi:hypothetical protein
MDTPGHSDAILEALSARAIAPADRHAQAEPTTPPAMVAAHEIAELFLRVCDECGLPPVLLTFEDRQEIAGIIVAQVVDPILSGVAAIGRRCGEESDVVARQMCATVIAVARGRQ